MDVCEERNNPIRGNENSWRAKGPWEDQLVKVIRCGEFVEEEYSVEGISYYYQDETVPNGECSITFDIIQSCSNPKFVYNPEIGSQQIKNYDI